MPESDTATGPIDSLIADIRVSLKRLKKAPIESWDALNRELQFNAYPTMLAICEQIAEVDDVIQEVVEQQESYLQPELAAQILKSIALGAALVEEVKKMITDLDDVARKRWSELLAEYEKETELAIMGLQDAMIDGDDDGDDGDDSDSDDEETE